jgi:hypothetical protein
LEVNSYLDQWRQKQITDYKMVLENTDGSRIVTRITIIVEHGEIISIIEEFPNSVDPESFEMNVRHKLSVFSKYTIMGLFEMAFACKGDFFCSVNYNSEYGYPEHISQGFHERSSLRVIDFQPLNEINS